jgi:hypothetical protein
MRRQFRVMIAERLPENRRIRKPGTAIRRTDPEETG